MKLRPIWSKRYQHWVLCHDQPCAKGETSIVAYLPAEAPAQSICDRYNDHPKPERYLEIITEAFEPWN